MTAFILVLLGGKNIRNMHKAMSHKHAFLGACLNTECHPGAYLFPKVVVVSQNGARDCCHAIWVIPNPDMARRPSQCALGHHVLEVENKGVLSNWVTTTVGIGQSCSFLSSFNPHGSEPSVV